MGGKEKEREETVLRIKKHFVGLASEETILPHVAINVDHYKFLVSLLSLMHEFFFGFLAIFLTLDQFIKTNMNALTFIHVC